MNDIPYLTKFTYQWIEDTVDTQSLEFLDEDRDENGSTRDDVRVELFQNPVHGQLSFSGNSFTYQPGKDFYGTDQFSVSLSDGLGQQVQDVLIEVLGTNDSPVVVNDMANYYDLSRSNLIQFNVLTNDHSGPDDPVEIPGYTISSFSSTTNGTLTRLYGGVFSYLPDQGFLGEDTFEYTINDQGETANGSVSLWVGKTASNPTWSYFRYFGAFMNSAELGKENWIYHMEMGWVYVHHPDQLIDASWIWRENLGWLWTGDKYFKWVYLQGLQQWLHWEGAVNGSGSWFLRTEQDVVYYEKDIIRMQVRDEVMKILPNISSLSDYIENSSFFSRAETVSIILELNRYGRSTTLNKILQFDFSY